MKTLIVAFVGILAVVALTPAHEADRSLEPLARYREWARVTPTILTQTAQIVYDSPAG